MLIVFQSTNSRKFMDLLACVGSSSKIVSVERNFLFPKISNKVFWYIEKARMNNEKIVFWPLEENEATRLWPLYMLLSNYSKALWFSPEPSLMSVLSDKLEAKELLEQNGFNVLPAISDFDAQSRYIVKPRKGSGSRGIKFVTGVDLARLPISDGLFVEERQVFESFHGISGVAQNGTIQFVYGHRRLVTKSDFGGASRLAQYENICLKEHALISSFLEKLKYTGCFMFEYGVVNNKNILIEMNPRLWGSFPISSRFFSKLIFDEFKCDLIKETYFDYYILLANFGAIRFFITSIFMKRKSKIFVAPNFKNFFLRTFFNGK
jgi:hypothetical protein